MTERRKTYTREFKLEVVHLADNTDKPIAHLERDLGLSVGTIHQWRRQVFADGEEAFPGSGLPVLFRACYLFASTMPSKRYLSAG